MTMVTDDMADAARQFILYVFDMPHRTYEGAREHLRYSGVSIDSWPEYAKTENGHLTKGGIADIIWHMMSSKHLALHASAAVGYKCADCTRGQTVACPDCYWVWWCKENPNTNVIGGFEGMPAKQEIYKKILIAIPYLRYAIAEASKLGKARLAITTTFPDGAGKLVAGIDTDFIDSVAILVNAPVQTVEDNRKAQVDEFLTKFGIKRPE